MRLTRTRAFCLLRDRRGFTRLEFGLLTAMLFAMVVNGIATLGGGLGSSSRPLGNPDALDDISTVAEVKPGANRAPVH